MLNPDREELKLQLIPSSETPKKNGYIPSWVRTPTFLLRTSLTILTAVPGTVIVADKINYTEGYSSQLATPTPTPAETVQPSDIYKLRLLPSSGAYVASRDWIEGLTLVLNNGGAYGATPVMLKKGQVLEISATGRMLLQDEFDQRRFTTDCKNSAEVDPDGKRYWRDTVCPPTYERTFYSLEPITKNAPRGSLIGVMNRGATGIFGNPAGPAFLVGSQWRGSANRDGRLHLSVNISNLSMSGYFDIDVKVYPLNTSTPTPKSVFTPASTQTREIPPATAKVTSAVSTPVPKITPIPTSLTERGSDLPTWLAGIGAAFLAGLGVNKLYDRLRSKKSPATGAKTASGTSSGFGTSMPFRIGRTVGLIEDPLLTQHKSPEWIIAQQEFEKRWQIAKGKLSNIQPGDTGNEPGYILDRFKAGMGIIHEVSLEDTVKVHLTAIKVRADIEYLIPEIWPNNRIFKRFFDPQFNAGFFTPEDIAKTIYLPEQYRNLLKFTEVQKRDIRRIHRVLIHSLHTDISTSDANPKLQEYVDELLKKFNPAWSYIDRMIK